MPARAVGDKVNVSFKLEASIRAIDTSRVPRLPSAGVVTGMSGFSGLLLAKHTVDDALQQFLRRMRTVTARPLGEAECYGASCLRFPSAHTHPWSFFPHCTTSACAGLTQTMVPISPTGNYTTPPTLGGAMVSIPSGRYFHQSTGIEDEGTSERGVDVQMPWDAHPQKTHSHYLFVPPLWVDQYPVTNQAYFEFLSSSGWRPADRERWLLHWGIDWARQGLPSQLTERPVVYVSLSDARAFCNTHGKRLPHRSDTRTHTSSRLCVTHRMAHDSIIVAMVCDTVGNGNGRQGRRPATTVHTHGARRHRALQHAQ